MAKSTITTSAIVQIAQHARQRCIEESPESRTWRVQFLGADWRLIWNSLPILADYVFRNSVRLRMEGEATCLTMAAVCGTQEGGEPVCHKFAAVHSRRWLQNRRDSLPFDVRVRLWVEFPLLRTTLST